MAKKLKFWRDNYGETVESADEFEVSTFDPGDDLRWAAEQYAEHFWNDHDGWECTWPITFCVADVDNKYLGKVSVDMQAEPNFYGKVVKDEQK